MHKKSDRKGLALGAIFALVVSLFGSVPAAQAATDGSDIGIYPVEGTTFTGTVVSDFPIYAQLKQTSTFGGFTTANQGDIVIKVEKTAGTNMDVLFTTSNAVVDNSEKTNVDNSNSMVVIPAGSTSATAAAIISGAGVTHIGLVADSTSAVASWSAVTLKVTIWVDEQGGAKDDEIDSDELYTTQIVTLLHPNSIGGAVTLTNPTAADTTVTVSAVVSGVNIKNLRGAFFLAMSSSHNAYAGSSQDVSVSVSNAVLAARSGVLSASYTVVSLSASDSIAAAVRYLPTWTGSGAGIDENSGYLAGSVVKKLIATPAVDTLYAKVTSADNATQSFNVVPVRPNQVYTIHAGAKTGSASVSGVVLSVALTGPTLTMPGSYIKINGGAATTSYPTALSVTTGANGYGTFTLETAGLAASDTNIVATVTYLNVTADTVTLDHTAADYFIDNAFDIYSATPGSSVALEFDVEDQWQVASKRTDQRIKLTRSGTGFDYGTSTVSYHVVTAGAASGTFVLPAATTGSALLDTVLQRYNQDTGQWEDGNAGTQITVNVTSVGSQFSTASALATTSASISYNVAGGTYSWSGNITVTGTVAGADMVVSAPGLVIHDNGSSKTASATMTIRANASKQITVKFAGEKAGTHTVSFTTAGNTTTSQVIISPAASTTGAVITYDTTNIKQGSTKKITGTLTDVLGNPVETDGHTASILVVYNGSGIALGTMPTNTDEDGEFSFNVIVGANDSGTATVTTTYLKNGASTATADKLTTVGQITIGAETVASADQKITVGTFKGYVAIYTKGYMGQKLSAKVAGRWLVVDPIAAFKSNDYSRTVRLTGAGYTITVDLYIDGAFVRSEVVTTK